MAINVRESPYFAAGDNTTDDTAALQSAADTGEALYVPTPPNKYFVEDEIVLKPGQLVYGDGEDKSVFHIKGSYNLAASAAPFKFPGGSEHGPELRDIGITFDQPGTSARASLTAYPPAIYARDQPRFKLRNVKVIRCMVAVDMLGNSGGATIERLHTSALKTAIDIDGSLDTVRVFGLHHWPYDLGPNLQVIFYDDITTALQSGRCDDLKLTDALFIGGRAMRLFQGATGVTEGTATGCRFDNNAPLYMEAGDLGVMGGHLTMGLVGKRGFYQTGGRLRLNGMKLSCAVGVTYPMVEVNANGVKAELAVYGCQFDTTNFDVKSLYVAASSTALVEVIGIGNEFLRKPNAAYAKQTIHIAANPRATMIGNRTKDKGAGAGTFIQVDADDHHRFRDNAPVGWGMVYPAPVYGTYSS